MRLYACGPTVYARAHIGNFRTFVCLDVLRRTLKYVCGYDVRQAVNYTDVDDKTIAGAPAGGRAAARLHGQVDRACFARTRDQLGIETPEEMPRATDEDEPAGDGRADRWRSSATATPIAATARSTSRSPRCRSTAGWRGSIATG